MRVHHFHDATTSTLTYVVYDEADRVAVVIDPVRDYDPRNARTSWTSCEEVASLVDHERLRVAYVVDTHAHADHLTGIPFFRERYGARSVTGKGIPVVQETFRDFYNLGDGLDCDGSQFDVLLDEGDDLELGSLTVEALHTPGHTAAHMSWRIGDAIFVGDTLFTPDYGVARCDFPGGSAEQLYASVQRLYAYPDDTRIFVCHDYCPGGRPPRPESSVAEQKSTNVQLSETTSEREFVEFRRRRDAELAAPALILPAVQVNIRAGELPPPEANGTSYLKIPVDRLGRRADG